MTDLRPLRVKITPEADCALHAQALANRTHKADMARSVLQDWAREQLRSGLAILPPRPAPPAVIRMAVSKSVRASVFERSNGVCSYCGISLDPRKWCADHVIPVKKGGSSELANLAAACVTCNAQKGSKSADVFRRRWGHKTP